jgi:hypothetical protein
MIVNTKEATRTTEKEALAMIKMTMIQALLPTLAHQYPFEGSFDLSDSRLVSNT